MAKTSSPQLLEPGGDTGQGSTADSARSTAEKSRDQLEMEIQKLQDKVHQAEQALRSVEDRMRKHKVQSNRMVLTMRLKLQRQEDMIRSLRKERERLMGHITSHLLFVEGELRREQKQIQRLLAEKDELIEKKSREISSLKATAFSNTRVRDVTVAPLVCQSRDLSSLLSIICGDICKENWEKDLGELCIKNKHFGGKPETIPEDEETGNDHTQTLVEDGDKVDNGSSGAGQLNHTDARTTEERNITSISRMPQQTSQPSSIPLFTGIVPTAEAGDDRGDPNEPEIDPKVLQLHGSYERLTDLGKKGGASKPGSARPYLTNHRSVTRPRDVKCRRQVARVKGRTSEHSSAGVGITRSIVFTL